MIIITLPPLPLQEDSLLTSGKFASQPTNQPAQPALRNVGRKAVDMAAFTFIDVTANSNA
jgi:hypothetical protein